MFAHSLADRRREASAKGLVGPGCPERPDGLVGVECEGGS